MKLTETKQGIAIEIYVKPNSAKFEVTLEGDEIVIRSTEEPTKGKVNKEIIKETSKLWGFQVEIVSGLTSKQKVLLLKGADKASAEAAFRAKLG